MDGGDVSDEACGRRLAEPGEMRRKAPVLVDGEQEIPARGELDELPADGKVLDERLLRQDVLAGAERPPHQLDANSGMSRDVDYFHGGIAENRLEIVGRARRREVCVAPGARMIEVARRDCDHLEPVTRVGL